ncbi:MAG: MazG nucleotide pyrophosphohydrolase domain-containing protein [Candidatus Acidiferrales bacterium]
MARAKKSSGQILLFPTGVQEQAEPHTQEKSLGKATTSHAPGRTRSFEAVLSGTYRKDPEGLKLIYHHLADLGCLILSPSNVEYAREVDGFVYMRGEEQQAPESIELRHLDAIQKASFVWLHAPEGYVGPTASLEVGFAHANGIPVFARNPLQDPILQSFVKLVKSPDEVVNRLVSGGYFIPSPGVSAFQNYYRRIAAHRGYEKEDAKDCLVLLFEEVGELARAIRQREKMVRHGDLRDTSEAQELADVFIYAVHLANTLGLDLSRAVRDKETLNVEKFLTKLQSYR